MGARLRMLLERSSPEVNDHFKTDRDGHIRRFFAGAPPLRQSS